VTIDGESVPVQYDPDTKKYIATSHSPYLNHDSLIDLAKHVADHVIAQRSP
jgi:outer membrane lipoprotein-sorting protein